ncbi:MAG: ornithine carbamoyltransferase [Thermodesulfobacteriota bacterium]|nr:ornithine carbamoyltransferase [Thermodesulfobacteriota bacterium]
MKKDLLGINDLTTEDIRAIITRAIALKKDKRNTSYRPLVGKTIGLIFEKASTRTRVSFEAAMFQLGGSVTFLSTRDTQLARQEPLADTARVLSRYLDGLVIRTFAQETVEELAAHATIPVINGLTDLYHPCQIVSDVMTVIEKKGAIENLRIAWVGDGNNVAHSWIEAAATLGFSLSLACPKDYEPRTDVLEPALKKAQKPILLLEDPTKAVEGADVINTDVWASMGQEDEAAERRKVFQPYQINSELLRRAKGDAIVLHCLPAHRGEEITAEVLEGPPSVVFDQAENKLHVHKAILAMMIK